jgi:hypothetical protein
VTERGTGDARAASRLTGTTRALSAAFGLAATLSLAFGGCGFFGDSTTAAGGGGGVPAPTVPTWWPTCGAPGCPDQPNPPQVPCNGDERPGSPCDYPGSACDARLACGAIMVCETDDPRGQGCP